ncbi:extracellular catalytic domain type 1 short-chain-length polyhydroxyalkanoate depolymerase [Achromobacter pestifer]|uniref:PHB depolymerase family esterase n=1 Tax=Achromobacter pestifer TaxID=1353889 RepID=A0A6S6YYF6_9BURK|nr:PHB depolymerase family esterase [Achromobacter pestifer]CAB3647529.1 hypothetical protein LMG3431_02577 [Achromobacter pestifer]
MSKVQHTEARESATFETGRGLKHLRYSSAQGERDYTLFVPQACGRKPMPLIIMLHGCKQDAADFSLGTGMNVLAEKHGCLVAYPIQPRYANPAKCWNWYRPMHQQRDMGEPSLIAGITRDIITDFDVDEARVYVAGLSAGGAMAAIMISTYPDLYAAAGIHSGLPYRRAWGLLSALAAMKVGTLAPHAPPGAATWAPQRPLIVFHGDLDKTVHPSNGRELLLGFEGISTTVSQEVAEQAEGRRSTRRKLTPAAGVDAEHWVVHDAPHAWAGGEETGSYTDVTGPDASAEMMRFFLAHSK